MPVDVSATPLNPKTATPVQVLIVEDDVPLARFLRKSLEGEAYKVDLAHDGEVAYEAINTSQYHLLILDLNLPKLDGMSLLTQVRQIRPSLSVLVLTARNRIEDRILSLDNGADDCLIKPFSFFELSARVRALLRRSSQLSAGTLRVADLELDRDAWRVERAGQRIELTTKEFAVLEYLMRNAGRPVSRAMLMENVWNLAFDPSTNLVDVYVKYVRDKVDANHPVKLIRTIRGVGYLLAGE